MIKDLMFKWLFKDKAREFEALDERNSYLESQITYSQPMYPTMADLMRDSLGLPMFDLTNVDKEGYPPHYLEGLNPDERKVFLAELNSIYKKPQFHAVLDFWTNTFGNHSIRKGKDEVEAGRYGINGVAMIRKSLEAAHLEIMDSLKPPEEFDKHSVLPEGDD